MNEEIASDNGNGSSGDKIKIKKSTLYLFGIILLVVIAGFFMLKSGGASSKDNSVSGDFQVVKVSVSRGTYIFSPSTFKVGIPVKLKADSSVGGCARSIVIPDFGVRSAFAGKDNSVVFTPDKTGTFNMACSMNMYRGTFEVVD